MRLYPRKLNSVEELRREKQMLRKKSKKLQQEDLFSFKQGHKEEDDAAPGAGSHMADVLSAVTGIMGSRSLLDAALAALPLVIRFLPDEKVKKVVGKAAREFGGGYLKWKGIEIGYRLIRRYIASCKQKHEKEKQPE